MLATVLLNVVLVFILFNFTERDVIDDNIFRMNGDVTDDNIF